MNDPGREPTQRLADLRRWNIGVGLVHLVQGVAILVLANGFSIDVVASVQEGPPGTDAFGDVVFFAMPFAPAIAIFLFLAAADHLLTATGSVRSWYESNLLRGINPARWVEYSISASIMVVLIAMLPGITNLYALMGLFAANSAMIGFGWLMERTNDGSAPVDWRPFVAGCLVGVVPWIAITTAIVASSTESGGVPGFVYGIFVSLFILFNCFAVNQWLQYRGRGRFADYLFGEKVYLVLSLVAKSALAWQVFAGTLAD